MQSPTKAEDSLQFILDVICKEKLQHGVGKAGEYLADNPKKVDHIFSTVCFVPR